VTPLLTCRASVLGTTLIALLGICPSASAQPAQGSPPPARAWSYFGGYTSHQLTNPGLHIGAEYPLTATAHFESLVAIAVLAYSQLNVERGYALHARWGQRLSTTFGLTFEGYFGVGAQLTTYNTTAYQFDDAVAVTKQGTTTRLAFAPNLVFGPGFDLERAWGIPFHLYAHPGVMLRYPDLNLGFQASIIAELGLRWTLR
jgi:hypothetical protein